MRNRLFMLIAILSTLLSCSESTENKDNTNIPEGNHKVLIEEVLQASSYSYLNVKEGDETNWIAVVKDNYQKGETYYYVEGLQMDNFKSKDLNRTFETVFFVNIISKNPITKNNPNEITQDIPEHHAKNIKVDVDNINIEAAKEGVTIKQLFSEKEKYSGKTVKIRGVVVKYNAKIMGKNWVHIHDGTKNGEDFDLTITTLDELAVGDTVTFEGKITLDKDFGAGYFFKLIMEEAAKI